MSAIRLTYSNRTEASPVGRKMHFVDLTIFYLQDNDGLIERWKRKQMENLLELHNKTPVWNEGTYGVSEVMLLATFQVLFRATDNNQRCTALFAFV